MRWGFSTANLSKTITSNQLKLMKNFAKEENNHNFAQVSNQLWVIMTILSQKLHRFQTIA